jgi:hypothetical protein
MSKREGNVALIAMTVESIAEKLRISESEALDKLYNSRLINLMHESIIYATFSPTDLAEIAILGYDKWHDPEGKYRFE